MFASPGLDNQLGKIVGSCQNKKSAKHVWLFKQWHLGAKINTKESPTPRAQDENQTAIYQQVESWIKANELFDIIAEGCTGEITVGFTPVFHGWSFSDLSIASTQNNYEKIDAHVPLKIKAKYKDAIQVICGDREDLIQETLLAFSDARGSLGFFTRLSDPSKGKKYLAAAIGIYNMPLNTKLDQAKARALQELKISIDRAKAALLKRNENIVATLIKSSSKEDVVIFGGVHATGIIELLNQKGISCDVVEPKGYQNDEVALLERLELLVKKL